MTTTEHWLHDHPYYPPSVVIPHYTPSSTPLPQILVPFGAIVAIIIGIAWYSTYRTRGTRCVDGIAAAWFALCAFLHITFEGYYILHRSDIAGRDSLFALLWKEYTLSDSRYLTLDVFTVCVESITVLMWGPLSLLTVYGILSQRHALRHMCQIVVCTAHLYGVALYYLTNWAEGVSYSRPEVLYFWVYYVGFNLPWAIVPWWLLWDSFSEMTVAFTALEQNKAETKSK